MPSMPRLLSPLLSSADYMAQALVDWGLTRRSKGLVCSTAEACRA